MKLNWKRSYADDLRIADDAIIKILTICDAMNSPRYPNVANRLMAAREAMLKPFRPLLRAHGLTGQQWRVIRALAEVPEGLAPNEISQRCQIVPPSLSQILTGMEKRGWVARQRSESDLRMQR